MMHAAESLAQQVRIKKACKAPGIPRASYYYYQRCKKDFSCKRVSLTPPLALSEQEQQSVLDILHSERFCDKARGGGSRYYAGSKGSAFTSRRTLLVQSHHMASSTEERCTGSTLPKTSWPKGEKDGSFRLSYC